jgi:hypothetical protein
LPRLIKAEAAAPAGLERQKLQALSGAIAFFEAHCGALILVVAGAWELIDQPYRQLRPRPNRDC